MKRYRVSLPADVVASLRRLSPVSKVRIRAALESLEVDPFIGKALQGPLAGLRSYRVSQYRIVYRIKAQLVLVEVLDIKESKVVYQKVARLIQGLRH